MTSGPLRGQPSRVRRLPQLLGRSPGPPSQRYDLRVNHPLNVDGAKVYLIGHGYAPVFRVTDGTGKVVFDQPVPFIAVEHRGPHLRGRDQGPGRPARPARLRRGVPAHRGGRGRPARVGLPGPARPAGEPGLLPGQPGREQRPLAVGVHAEHRRACTQLPVAPRPLAVGQSIKLPGGAGTLTFTGYRQWISLAITYDPGQLPALIAGLAALAGLLLSFFIRRRRMFVRAYPGPGGTVVDVGGLARSDPAGGFDEEFAGLAAALAGADQGREPGAAAEGAPRTTTSQGSETDG